MTAISLIIKIDGQEHELVYEEGDTLLDSAIRASLNPPYSCMEGVCTSCLARIEEGEVEMPGGEADEDDIEAGLTLTCQARPKSGRVVINYDDV